MALTPEKMSPKGIALFCLEASLSVSLPYNIAFSFSINLGITFSIFCVMFRLIVSIRSSNFMYLFLYWLHTVMWIASARYSLVLVFSSVMGPWLSFPNPSEE